MTDMTLHEALADALGYPTSNVIKLKLSGGLGKTTLLKCLILLFNDCIIDKYKVVSVDHDDHSIVVSWKPESKE